MAYVTGYDVSKLSFHKDKRRRSLCYLNILTFLWSLLICTMHVNGVEINNSILSRTVKSVGFKSVTFLITLNACRTYHAWIDYRIGVTVSWNQIVYITFQSKSVINKTIVVGPSTSERFITILDLKTKSLLATWPCNIIFYISTLVLFICLVLNCI